MTLQAHSIDEMGREYAPCETITLAGGRYSLVVSEAARLAPGALVLNQTSGRYRRACLYPTDEQAALDAGPRLTAPRFHFSTSPANSSSPWSSRPGTSIHSNS